MSLHLLPNPHHGYLHCPYCGGTHIVSKNTCFKLGLATGIVGGAIRGFIVANKRITTTTPVGWGISSLSGAVVGAIVGAASYGFMGARLGRLADEHLCNNHFCYRCGHHFQFPPQPPFMRYPAPDIGCSDDRTVTEHYSDEEWESEPLETGNYSDTASRADSDVDQNAGISLQVGTMSEVMANLEANAGNPISHTSPSSPISFTTNTLTITGGINHGTSY